jgi:lipopolysaccharide heptosyltransferase II
MHNGKMLDNWEKARNILCVRLDSLGDVLMTTPAMRALKESGSGRRITLLTSPEGARIAGLIPEIDEVIEYEAPWMKASNPRSQSSLEFSLTALLRQLSFDGAVIFTVYTQNPLPAAFLCYLAEIPLRLAHCRENPYQLLTDWVIEKDGDTAIRHEVRRQLDLVATIGALSRDERLSLRVSEKAQETGLRKLEQAGLDRDRFWVVIHPGASAASRRYPAEGFSEIARRLVDELGAQVVFTGSKTEIPLVAEIQNRMEAASISVAGQLELAELAACLAACQLLISNNTGPVHIAAAVGAPVVDLYALTNPQHTPWMTPNRVLFHDVPCKFCYKSICPEGHHDCLRRVTPERVVEAASDLLVETHSFARQSRIKI